MERKILQRMEQLEKIKKGLEKRLQGVQIRKVECKKIRGHYRYYLDQKYVGKQEITALKRLVEEEYYAKLLPEIEKQIANLRKALRNIDEFNLEKIYNDMHAGKRKLITTGILSREEKIRRFAEETYEGKPIEEIGRKFIPIKASGFGQNRKRLLQTILRDGGFCTDMKSRYS